jgi:hypothetical protein
MPGYHIDPLSSSLPNSQSSDTPLYSPRDGSLRPAIDLDNVNYELTSKYLDRDLGERLSKAFRSTFSKSFSALFAI